MTCAPTVRFDWSFPREYEILHPAGLGNPATLPQIYYPGASREGGNVGLMVRVIPKGRRPWIAAFQSSIGAGPIILSTPDPHKFCAVSYGAAYFVNAEDPDDWFEVEHVIPVRDARSLPNAAFILFCDYTNLAAYRPDGPVWVSERVCDDWLRITEITNDTIKGVGFDAPRDNEDAPFAVDLKTGRIRFSPFHKSPNP